jgi:hypothetical protein
MQREYTPALRDPSFFIRKFRLEVVDGPEHGRRVDSLGDELTIGSAASATAPTSAEPAASAVANSPAAAKPHTKPHVSRHDLYEDRN